MAKFLSWDRLKEYDGLIKTHVGNLYNELIGKINGKANSSHTHSISNVENLESSLASKSDSNHVHNYAGSTSNGGSANSALKLATGRAINGINFDGTAPITITANPTETSLTGVDLNDYKSPGFYYGGGSNGCTNVPSGIDAFGMVVFKNAGGYTCQLLVGGNNKQNIMYVRTYTSSAWSAWVTQYSDVNKPTPAAIGASASGHNHDDRYYTESEINTKVSNLQSGIDGKVDKVSGKGLSSSDYTAAEKTKLAGIAEGAQKNTITGVKGNSESSYRTGNVNITKANIGLGNVDNTTDVNKPLSTAQKAYIDDSLETAKEYTDEKIGNLIDGAPTTLDTLKEIADAMATNDTVVDALESAIGNKTDKAFSNVLVGSTTIAADGKADTLTLASGGNITITPDATNDKVTFTVADGTTGAKGVVKLSSTVADNETLAATPKAVKSAYDLANTAKTTADSKAPTSHASTGTSYGVGTSSNYGHVKLSDATNSTSAASAGIAASPAAVKAAYDLANGRVPSTRKVNNKALSADITLSASDVSALPIGGGTLTGSVEAKETDETYITSKVTNSKGSVGLYAASNRGLYDFTKNEWMVYTNSSNNVVTLNGNCTGNAGTATKLATARTIGIGNDFSGSATFDGSANITVSAKHYNCDVGSNDVANLPWHRIAYTGTVTANHNDRDMIIMINHKYNGGNFGILKVSLRTNNMTSTATADVSASWLVRRGFAADAVKVGLYKDVGKAYADLYLKVGSYARCTVYQLSGNRTWTLVSSTEQSSTSTAAHVECYASVESAATALYNLAYTSIVDGTDVATVNYANSAGSSTKVTATATNPTSGTTYYLPFHSGTTTGSKSLLTNDGLGYYSLQGTTSTLGSAELKLGNNLASGTAGNKVGKIYMYGSSTGYTYILPTNNTTSNITVNLPSTGGTLALNTAATQSANGLMSAADKKKLDGIATGANKITVDTALSDSSTNPVQNKVINAALAGKANSSHGTHVTYGTSASALGTSSAGTATTVSRSDHVHALPALTSCTGTLTVAKGGTGATKFTSGAALIGAGTGAVTTRAITNMTAKNYITYNTNLMTTNTLAYWNGSYQSNGASNLTYCNQGAFGSIVTKGSGDYLPIGGGTLTGKITMDKTTYNDGYIELSGTTPFVDFYYNDSTDDYSVRLICNGQDTLDIFGGSLYVGGTSDTTWRASYVRNQTGAVGIHIAASGNAGVIYNDIGSTSGDWMMYRNKDNNTVFIPNVTEISTTMANNVPLTIKSGSDTSASIEYKNGKGTVMGYLGVNSNKNAVFNDTSNTHTVLHSGNYSSYALPKTGGTLNGALTVLGRIGSGNTSTNGGIDIYHDTPYLDFHFGKSSSDYTTRIIEKESGNLTIQAKNVITSGNVWTGASTDGTYHTIYARNKYGSGGIHVSTASNVGLMNNGISTWIIRMPSDGVCRIAEKLVLADNFHTEKNNQMTLGTPSYKWKQLYAATATINTSDRNDKKDFRMFDSNENYEKFFMDLKPMVFKFKNGESGRDHFGFVSQDVEESLYKYGFDDKSFAGFCKDAIIEEIEGEDGITREVPKLDEDGNEQYVYGLRYSEFTAMNTYMIQKIVKENEELKEENKAFKAEIEEIKKVLAELKG